MTPDEAVEQLIQAAQAAADALTAAPAFTFASATTPQRSSNKILSDLNAALAAVRARAVEVSP